MKSAMRIQVAAVWLATVGLCIPQVAFAAQPSATVADVSLHSGGVLVGQVVTPESAAVTGTTVTLSSGEKLLGESKTDKNGYFAFSGLNTGVYQVAAAEGRGTVRAWDQPTAPPAAQPGVLVVAGQDMARGQSPMTGVRNVLANPLVLTGIVATAIVLPITLSQDDSSSGN